MLLSISPITLAHEISQARQHVYYSGAGIDKEVSDALITLNKINPSVEIIVVSDCSSHARRLGYGNQESLKNLQQQKIPVFEQQGVRLSFCLIDHSGWVFSFSDLEFQNQLKQQFPLVPWVMPMEEYTAAKGEQVEHTDLFESQGI